MSETRKIICIVCPQGCIIEAKGSGKKLVLEGYKCKRGEDYARKEVTEPERTITSSITVKDGELPLVSVKTDKPIPKKKIMDLMKCIKKAKVKAPVDIGDVLIEGLDGTKVNVVATKKVGRAV